MGFFRLGSMMNPAFGLLEVELTERKAKVVSNLLVGVTLLSYLVS